jgi:hypothetical protein
VEKINKKDQVASGKKKPKKNESLLSKSVRSIQKYRKNSPSAKKKPKKIYAKIHQVQRTIRKK